MSWRKQGDGPPRGYHHGNLKEALVRAALDLIREKGPAGFTFAEAARSAGVSPAAPYRHFRDRDELLSNIAQRGFELFEQVLAKAWDDGRPDTVTAFMRVGRAYLAFMEEENLSAEGLVEASRVSDWDTDQVPPEVRQRRLARLIEVQNRISQEINEACLGEVVEVLGAHVDGESANNHRIHINAGRLENRDCHRIHCCDAGLDPRWILDSLHD